MQGAKVLQLPLNEDAYLKHTMDLSLQYYKARMTVEDEHDGQRDGLVEQR